MANANFDRLQDKITAMLKDKRAGVTDPNTVKALNRVTELQRMLTDGEVPRGKLQFVNMQLDKIFANLG